MHGSPENVRSARGEGVENVIFLRTRMVPKATPKNKIKMHLCLANKIHDHYIIASNTRRSDQGELNQK